MWWAGVRVFFVFHPFRDSSSQESSSKEEIAKGFFSLVSFWYHPDYPSLLPTSVPLGLLGAHTLKQ